MHGEVDFPGEVESVGKNVWVVLEDDPIANYTKVDFIIDRTEISYGVNLIPVPQLETKGAGDGIILLSHLRYDSTITISNCSFRNNFGSYSTHLSVGIYANSSVLVKDCSFTFANRINSELVQAIYPEQQTVSFRVIYDEFVPSFIIDVTVTLTNISITENYDGGLGIISEREPRVSQTNIHEMVKDMKIMSNFFLCHNAIRSTAVTLIEREIILCPSHT